MFHIVDLLCAVPNIAIVQYWRQEEIEEHYHCKGIACDVERGGQWCTSIVDLGPIETDGEQAEARVHLESVHCQPVPLLRRVLVQLTPKMAFTF